MARDETTDPDQACTEQRDEIAASEPQAWGGITFAPHRLPPVPSRSNASRMSRLVANRSYPKN